MILELALDLLQKKTKNTQTIHYRQYKNRHKKTWCCALLKVFSIINTKNLAMFRYVTEQWKTKHNFIQDTKQGK